MHDPFHMFVGMPGEAATLKPRTPLEIRGKFPLAEIHLQDGESLESALKRFKRKVMNEEIIKDIKKHAFYLKPGQRKRLKAVEARKRARKNKSRSRDGDSDQKRS